MLSVLIPVFNFDVRNLVREIHEQAIALQIPFEIVCFDDASDQKYVEINNELSALSFIKIINLPKNIGRSAIRNRLAEEAKYDQLLFMDCDSKIMSKDYIKSYIGQLHPEKLIYGGRVYDPQPPSDSKLMLHWVYGSNREVIPVGKRKLQPYKSFQTNNFVIPKKIFISIKLNEALKGYGHEDTLLGNDLESRKIEILHIENPLCHIGLESAEEFLRKTDQGLDNLCYLMQNNMKTDNIKLVLVFKRLRCWGMTGLYYSRYGKRKQDIKNNLLSERPDLRLFDHCKLISLIEKNRNYKKAL
jgi:glycosyltransferase involved in cell wall biosynthesis